MSTTQVFAELAKVTTPKVEQKPETPVVEQNPKTPDVEQKSETPQEPQGKVIKSVFGDFAIGKEEKPEVIDTPEKFFERMKKETGREDIDAFDKVFQILNDPNKVPKSQLEEAEQKVIEYDQFFSNMPTELHAVIADYFQQKDYKETMKKVVGKVDYSKPATAYTQEQLILMYNPDETNETIEDMTEREIKALYKAAEIEYSKEHNALKEKAEIAKKIEFDNAKKFVSSIDASVEHLKKQMPNLGTDKIKDITDKMKKGYTLFDGVQYRPDAAYRIALAEYGKDFVQQIIDETVKITQRQVEQAKSKTNEEILKEKTNDALTKSSKELPPQNPEEEVRRTHLPFLKPPKVTEKK